MRLRSMQYVVVRWRHLLAALSCDGRLQVARPWLLAIGPLGFLLALVAPYILLFFVAYVYLLVVVAAYLWVRLVGLRIEVRRRLRGHWAQVGDTLEEEWQLTNAAPLPLLWLELDDGSNLPGYNGRRVVSASAGEVLQWRTSAICTQRGVYTLGPLTARLGDPFGLFRFEWRERESRQIVVYPPLVRLPPLAIPQGQRGGLARADLLQQYATPSVGGLREYTPGDLLSHIHWPTVARTDRLMVKEFDQERAGALWIVLDLWAGAYASPGHTTATMQPQFSTESDIYGGSSISLIGTAQTSQIPDQAVENRIESPLELAIVLACSLAAQALSEGRAVGLLADDGRRRLVTPGRGPRQLWRILSELVDVQATGSVPLAHLLQQGHTARANETAGAAVVVVTPALEDAWLPALAAWLRGSHSGALALLIAQEAGHAAPLTARLAAGGVFAQTFEVGAVLPLLNPARPRTDQRISPLGKVVQGRKT